MTNKYEISCGAVVFTRRKDEIFYLIIQSREGIYGFPKGHMEGNETEIETALREIYEETGLQVEIDPAFRIEDAYPLPRKPGVTKRVVYFAATYHDQTIRIQKEELRSASLMRYEDAMAVFQFEGSRRILQAADQFLRGK